MEGRGWRALSNRQRHESGVGSRQESGTPESDHVARRSRTMGRGGNVARMESRLAPQRFNVARRGNGVGGHEPVPRREGRQEFVPRWPDDRAAVDPYRFPGY